jgi:hypothetical protein
MQIDRVLRLRDDATDLDDRSVVRRGRISNWTRTTGPSGLLTVGNLDRGWLIAVAWTLGTQAEGEINMLARLRTVFYWCSLAIALVCWIAALTILTAIITGKLSDSNAWIAMMFFAAVGCICWLAGRGAKYLLDDIDEV